ncbi:MobA family protein [Acinetobacter bereziniae]|uniref:MobA family protein n=1 Tax=Acinetobacter bereziniae TaxID=106648 RepID=A0A8I1DJ74_ACIBZ|nr:MobA family protein [Acinetobacter bereziniae]QQC83627.1 MobA family protein [Acinetobacter bereziniae]UUN96800.1 MobA family protein [Acinetobacter bereziniae]
MLIKMLRHGTGSAARAAAYVLDEKDHMNIIRPHVEVLCGDPHLFAKIADSSPFKHKYTSAVIAFAEEDRPTDVEIKDVLKQFEALAFSGLEPDQYHMTAVLHQELNGSKHIHILVPRLELRSGKAMNIAPPGRFQKHFHMLQDKLNFEYGWSDPNDPDRARFTKKGHETYLHAALKKIGKDRENYKQYIENLYLKLLSISLKQLEKKHAQVIPSELLVRNRDDFMQFVLNNKLASEVVKIREKQFSLVPPFGKKPIYFQGEMYERQFNIEKCSRTIRERIKSLEQVRTADRERGNDEQRTVNQISKYTRTPCAQLRDRAEQALQGARQTRADYNRQRYASVTAPEERDTDVDPRIEIISRRLEAEYQQYSNDAVIASQRNQYDNAKAYSAEQSPITTNDRRQSKLDQRTDSEQCPSHHTDPRKSEETVAAASRSGINSVDHSQPEIDFENIYSDGAWNVAAEYFNNITRELLYDTADLDQKRDRNLDGRQGQSFPSNYFSEMGRLQYTEFEQKNDSSNRAEYSSDLSMHCGEMSHERTATYDYSVSQRQRHTADDFGFTRTNEFSFDAIVAEYYARLARKRREDEKKAQRDRALRAEQQRRHEQDIENLRLQQSVRLEPSRDQFISEYWIDDQRVTIEAGKIRTVRATAAVTASERAATSRTEHFMRYTDQQTRALNSQLDQALRCSREAGDEFEKFTIAIPATNQEFKRDDAELHSEYEQFKQHMRRLREQADADQEHAASMQQQYQYDREHSAELTATILQLAKLVEEIVRLMMNFIATMLGQQYNIQRQPQVEAKQQKSNHSGPEF